MSPQGINIAGLLFDDDNEATRGQLLVVPLEEAADGIWRPVTAFTPTPQQAARYGSRP